LSIYKPNTHDTEPGVAGAGAGAEVPFDGDDGAEVIVAEVPGAEVPGVVSSAGASDLHSGPGVPSSVWWRPTKGSGSSLTPGRFHGDP